MQFRPPIEFTNNDPKVTLIAAAPSKIIFACVRAAFKLT